MFCNRCGGELEEGKRFCVFCGAEQGTGGAGAPGGAPRKPGGISTLGWVIISVVALLAAAGIALGIYFGVRGGESEKPPTTTGDKEDSTVIDFPEMKNEKLAYLDAGDINTIRLNGTSGQKITSRGDIVDFAVSPDGSWVAYVVAAGDQKIIFKRNLDEGAESQVTLPEKGLAENPVFSPDGKYIYFTRVTPEDLARIEAAEPYSVGFERYDIAANKVDHLYTHGGLQEQSIEGLYADPGGQELYFNLYGSDWPSSVPYKLTLGTPVTESVFMPMVREAGEYTAVAYRLTGFSKRGTYISYFKDVLFDTTESQSGPSQEIDAAFRRRGSSSDTVVATYEPSASRLGEVAGIEFSRVFDGTYYFAKVQSENAASLTLAYYRGGVKGEPSNTGLDVTIATDPEAYTPLVWHLLPTGQ